MNQLTIGQCLPLRQFNIDDTALVALKLTCQSPIEIDISCFVLDSACKLFNHNYMVLHKLSA